MSVVVVGNVEAVEADPGRERVGEPRSVPTHVAIIMDGNGRWAAARSLPRVAGHRAGVQAVRRAVQAAVWKQMEMQDFKLEGIMRTATKLHPIILRTKNREMVYEFKDTALQVRVELTSQGSNVQRRKKAGDSGTQMREISAASTCFGASSARAASWFSLMS